MESKEAPMKYLKTKYLKTLNRLVAGLFLLSGDTLLAGVFFIIAESLTIVEELS